MLNACTKLCYFTRGKEIINKILVDNNPIFIQNTKLITTMIDLLVSLVIYRLRKMFFVFHRVNLETILNYVFNYLIQLNQKNVHHFYIVQ